MSELLPTYAQEVHTCPELSDEYWEAVTGLARSASLGISRPPLVAEPDDVAQETAIRVYRDLEDNRLTPERALQVTGRKAKSLTIDGLRSASARRYKIEEQHAIGEAAQPSRIGVKSTEDAAVERLLTSKLLAVLSPEQADLIKMNFIMGYTREEIARKIGKPLGTVKASLHRSLMKMRAEGEEKAA